MHAFHNGCGSVINWAREAGFFDDFSQLEALSSEAQPSHVFFLPAFGGYNNDPHCGSGFIGIDAHTKREDFLRAILESLAFVIYELFSFVRDDYRRGHNGTQLKCLRAAGGVSTCDFLCQIIANLSETPVERCNGFNIASGIGAAFLAASGFGLINDYASFQHIIKPEKVFQPIRCDITKANFRRWKSVVPRFAKWHSSEEETDHWLFFLSSHSPDGDLSFYSVSPLSCFFFTYVRISMCSKNNVFPPLDMFYSFIDREQWRYSFSHATYIIAR